MSPISSSIFMTFVFAPPWSGAVHVFERAGDDARRKGRSVQLVVGVEDQSDVEDVRFVGLGALAAHHVQKVFRDRQRVVGLDHVLAGADAFPGGDQRADLRRQLDGGFDGRVAVRRVAFGVVKPERRNARPEHVHRVGVFRKRFHHFDDFRGNRVIGLKLCF
jgi:hypothetical protein